MNYKRVHLILGILGTIAILWFAASKSGWSIAIALYFVIPIFYALLFISWGILSTKFYKSLEPNRRPGAHRPLTFWQLVIFLVVLVFGFLLYTGILWKIHF